MMAYKNKDEEGSEDKKRPSKVMVEWEDMICNIHDINRWELSNEYDGSKQMLFLTIVLYLHSYPFKKVYKYQTEEARQFALKELKDKLKSKDVLFL